MRRFVAAAVAVAALASAGCRDNPGFGLITLGSAGETASETGEPPISSSSGPAESTTTPTAEGTETSAASSSTGAPVDPTTGTTGEPPLCGNGVLDPGEDCDLGDVDPGDGCEANCKRLFTQGFAGKFGEQCTTIVAGRFDADDGLPELALARANSPAIWVLQNVNGGTFVDMQQAFVFEIAATAVAVEDIDHANGADLVVLQGGGAVWYCLNDAAPTPNYCDQAAPIGPPDDPAFGNVLGGILEVADIAGDGFSDVVIATDKIKLGYAPGLSPGVFGEMQSLTLPPAISGAPGGLALHRIVPRSANLDLVVTFTEDGNGHAAIVPNFLIGMGVAGPVDVGAAAGPVAVAPLGLFGDLPELVVLDPGLDKLWFLADEDNVYKPQGPGIPVGDDPSRVFAVALRGPGTQDIVVVDAGGPDVFIAAVAGEVPTAAHPQNSGLTAVVDVAFADVDGDDDIDLAAIDGDCNLRILLNQTEA